MNERCPHIFTHHISNYHSCQFHVNWMNYVYTFSHIITVVTLNISFILLFSCKFNESLYGTLLHIFSMGKVHSLWIWKVSSSFLCFPFVQLPRLSSSLPALQILAEMERSASTAFTVPQITLYTSHSTHADALINSPGRTAKIVSWFCSWR